MIGQHSWRRSRSISIRQKFSWSVLNQSYLNLRIIFGTYAGAIWLLLNDCAGGSVACDPENNVLRTGEGPFVNLKLRRALLGLFKF